MLLRANVLLRPTSGVRPELVDALVALLNAGIVPRVPEQGSVGASGDLAPLSHVALVLMGEGEVLEASGAAPAAPALGGRGLAPFRFAPKEGLAFINGTQAQTALLALLVHDARVLWRTAVGAAAMSLEDTGPVGLPRAKQEMMSVPPLMLARCTSRLMSRTRSRSCAGASGLPVERIARSGARSWRSPGSQALLLGQRQIFRAGAEHGDPLAARPYPRGVGGGDERRAVVKHDRGAHRQARHQPVPHHPAAGGEVEDAVVAA